MFDARGRELKEFKEWAAERAIMLEAPPNSEANVAANLAKLAALDASLDGKRVAFVGEPDHFIHEKYDYRLLMLRFLASRGFDVIGEELGVSDGSRIARFLATGDEAFLNRVSIYGYKGGTRADRTDKPTGLLSDSYATKYPEAEFSAEQKRFARNLREIFFSRGAGGSEMRFFGFDIDGLPGGGYEDIAELIRPFAHLPPLNVIASKLTRVPNESLDDEVARLDAAVTLVEADLDVLFEILGADRAARLAHFARALRDSFRYITQAFPAATWPALNEEMAFRETTMHRNFDDVVTSLPDGARISLMSHNLHLARDYPAIKQKIGAGPGGGLVDAIGTYIYKKAGGQVFSVWMLCNRGRDAQPFSFCSNDIKPVPGSLNAILAELGPNLVLPLRSGEPLPALLQSEIAIQMDGTTGVKAEIGKQVDAIFFIDEVSPLRI